MSPADDFDPFAAAVAAASIVHAHDRRVAGQLAHRAVDAEVLVTIARLLPGIRAMAHAASLYDYVRDIEVRIQRHGEAAQAELQAALARDHAAVRWRPQPGAQALAWEVAQIADQTLMAGGAGSGKSLVAVNMCALESRAARIIRRTALEFTPLQSELAKLTGTTDGRNLSTQTWTLPPPYGWRGQGAVITFTGLNDEDARLKVQGQPTDLQFYDDCASGQLDPADLAFVSRWNRTTVPGLRPKIILTANPPTSVHGEWVKTMFAPWLDDSHPNPAKPGELRWMDGDNREVAPHTSGSVSRTCVTSTVRDNCFLMRTNYQATLEATPDATLRAKLLLNDWNTATDDDPYAVFPARWVDAAFARYRPDSLGALTACGLDVARGGRDSSVLAMNHGNAIGPLRRWPGTSTPDGHSLAALVLAARGNSRCAVHIDAIGVGSGAVDALRPRIFELAVPVNSAAGCTFLDPTGSFGFTNLRAWMAWNLRTLLDPSRPDALAICPDKLLRAELLAYRYSLAGGRLQVEGKDEIVKRLHRSPDAASALMLATIPVNSSIARVPGFLRALYRSNQLWLETQHQAP